MQRTDSGTAVVGLKRRLANIYHPCQNIRTKRLTRPDNGIGNGGLTIVAKGILLALSNPVSGNREDEFNHWYNEIHGKEVTGLKGFAALTRYKLSAQLLPPTNDPKFRYVAIYELDDVDQALKSLAEDSSKFAMSDSVDLPGALGMAFEKVYSTKD
jgi:hypothetical protein